MTLVVKDLRVEWPGFVLEADFSIPAGGRAVLTGPSGSGKTTLLRAIAGLESARGRVRLGEVELAELPVHRRRLGMVFQEPALFPELTVGANAAFGLRMQGRSHAEQAAAAEQWLARVGLAGRAQEGVGHLSGGEKQRLALIRALAPSPGLLLLDEPFSALDPALRSEMRRLLLDLLAGLPVPPPLLLVSHDPDDAAALATQRLVLEFADGGRLLRCLHAPMRP